MQFRICNTVISVIAGTSVICRNLQPLNVRTHIDLTAHAIVYLTYTCIWPACITTDTTFKGNFECRYTHAEYTSRVYGMQAKSGTFGIHLCCALLKYWSVRVTRVQHAALTAYEGFHVSFLQATTRWLSYCLSTEPVWLLRYFLGASLGFAPTKYSIPHIVCFTRGRMRGRFTSLGYSHIYSPEDPILVLFIAHSRSCKWGIPSSFFFHPPSAPSCAR